MREGWEYKKLGDVAIDMFRGSGIKRDQVTESGTPCVRYGEIYTTYNIAFEECVSHTIEENITPRKYFENGDLLFAITGESVEEIGKTIAYIGKEKCLAGGDIVVMKHLQNAKYLSYALSSPSAIKQKGYGKTKLKVVHTSVPSLKSISIPLPPLSEQQEIVNYLDSAFARIDAMKANAEKALEEGKALFQAALKQMLEPKEGWEERKLGDVCDFRSGFAFKSNLFTSSGQPIIRISDIQNEKIDDSNLVYFDPSSYSEDLSKYLIYPNDILIAMSGGTTGKLGINTSSRNFYLNQRVGVFREKKNILNHKYLYYFLHTKSEESLKIAAGAAQPNLSTAQIKSFTIPFPSLSEQQTIVETLDTIKSKVDHLQKNYDTIVKECDALKQAILRQVFE